jgi:hypothetical protein
MQLMVLESISGVVAGVIRHVYGSIKKAWSETEIVEEEPALAPVVIEEEPG